MLRCDHLRSAPTDAKPDRVADVSHGAADEAAIAVANVSSYEGADAMAKRGADAISIFSSFESAVAVPNPHANGMAIGTTE